MALKINMETPKSCMKCRLADHYDSTLYCRVLNDFVKGLHSRAKVCPLIEDRRGHRGTRKKI